MSPSRFPRAGVGWCVYRRPGDGSRNGYLGVAVCGGPPSPRLSAGRTDDARRPTPAAGPSPAPPSTGAGRPPGCGGPPSGADAVWDPEKLLYTLVFHRDGPARRHRSFPGPPTRAKESSPSSAPRLSRTVWYPLFFGGKDEGVGDDDDSTALGLWKLHAHEAAGDAAFYGRVPHRG